MIPRFTGRSDVVLAGIVEPNAELAAKYAKEYHLDSSLFFPTLEALLAKTKVQAVSAFTSTYDHRRVVEMCAPLGIDVMMEKPLATTNEDAAAIAAAAKKGGIQVIVNYETTWYPSVQSAYGVIHSDHTIGDLRRIVVHDGHEGPAVIGCSPYFFSWLTDPVLNGGGALMDFGCYGADLVTWLMEGQRPLSVFATTRQCQPEVYPKVDDDATIVVTYPKTTAILQASWNWPYDRKDMEIYGQTGALFLPKKDSLLLRPGRKPQVQLPAPALKGADRRSPFLPCRGGPRGPQALRALGSRREPGRDRDPRGGPGVRNNGQADRFWSRVTEIASEAPLLGEKAACQSTPAVEPKTLE